MQPRKPAGPIRILSPELQNQIAAGEVVERPASVLKELVENSLDAGADRIEVTIEGGGQSLIAVQDNGFGMSPQDMELALTRHATSKIVSIEDLAHIESFGFRGEALPSIASVSRLAMCSIEPESIEGFCLETEFGGSLESYPAPLREGTRVEVRDLFLNTPARLKFLKTWSTEGRKCQEVLQRIALANLQAGFSLTSNNRLLFSCHKGQSLPERLQIVWPERITSSLLPVEHQLDHSAIRGLVGAPDAAQARPDRILFYVNNRPVQSRVLQSALKQAYAGRILSKEHPQAALFLELPSGEVDINVHPAKAEVRFREEKKVFSLTHAGVQQALLSAEGGLSQGEGRVFQPPVNGERGRTETRGEIGSYLEWEETSSNALGSGHGVRAAEDIERASQAAWQEPLQTASPEEESLPQGTAYLGQLRQSYLLLRLSEEELWIVDQHAAHERVLFSRYRSAGHRPQTQNLAFPLELTLHPAEQALLEAIAPYLRRLGFAFDRPHPEVLSVRGMPNHLDRTKGRDFLQSVLGEQVASMDDLWVLMACRNAVKAGEPLAAPEAKHLLTAWLQCEERWHCPHGRPAALRFDEAFLERLFKRRG
jgi:DNA mismatch repair protein MutL